MTQNCDVVKLWQILTHKNFGELKFDKLLNIALKKTLEKYSF